MTLRSLLIAGLAAACVSTTVSPTVDEDPLVEIPDDEPEDPLAPVADAGEDFMASPLSRVQLDGTRSFDPQGLGLIPEWRFVRVPKGSQAVMDRADDLQPEFFADLVGTYEVELVVQNEAGIVDATPDRVVVDVVPSEALYMQLRWNTDVDLDLHVVPVGESVWGPKDCTWCNPNPEWGVRDVFVDDASLDWDVIDGYGPETVTIAQPADGHFRAFVDVYGQGGLTVCRAGGCPPTRATLDVYVRGKLTHTAVVDLDEAGQLWEAIEVQWPSGLILPVDFLDWTDVNDCQTE